MNLSEVEVIAGQLVEQKRRLGNLDAELSRVQQELKELPRRSEKDRQFYSLIGMDYQEPQFKNREGELLKERGETASAVKQAYDSILRGFSSSDLVVPLDPSPTSQGKHFTFRYRFNASYPRTVEALSDILGIPSPINVGAVIIGADRVEVEEVDEFFAKQKVVEAFSKIQKTVALKLGPRR
jgi:hypothetical protein